jgi:peroxiredoxin
MMKRFALVASLLVSIVATPSFAAMKSGDPAPDFTIQAAVGGKTFAFSLADALKHGPVVLYFYPKSYTKGCTIEAHEFADAAAKFAAAGASLIGVSRDTIETQVKFSSEGCRDKFPVGADPTLKVIRAYDAQRIAPTLQGQEIADRISYVIAPPGKIIYVYADPAPDKHIENTLAAVRQWSHK